jgi:hypothetical protein
MHMVIFGHLSFRRRPECLTRTARSIFFYNFMFLKVLSTEGRETIRLFAQ